jgi:hypothetical protein
MEIVVLLPLIIVTRVLVLVKDSRTTDLGIESVQVGGG